MSEPREFTFGDEDEAETRTRQENDLRSMVRSTFGTQQMNLQDAQRLDPREFLAVARVNFLEAAQKAGLNAHEALHSWGDGVEVESVANVAVTAGDYCKFKIAEKLGITVEELDRQRDAQREQVSERIAQMLRGMKGEKPDTLN